MDGNLGSLDLANLTMDYDFRQLVFDDYCLLHYVLAIQSFGFAGPSLPVSTTYGTGIYLKDFVCNMIVSSIYLYL